MMRRPWLIWILFALCLIVAFGAMAWITLAALELDRAEREARQLAALEENVRLALWRMDSALSPLIAQENARPYFAYSPFYPAQRAYTRMFAELKVGDVLIPSPLIRSPSPYIILYFQFDPKGKLTSPQVPTGNMLDVAESRKYTTRAEIVKAEERLKELAKLIGRDALLSTLPSEEREVPAAVRPQLRLYPKASVVPTEQASPQPAEQQSKRNEAEMEWRSTRVKQYAAQDNVNADLAWQAVAPNVAEGTFRPKWINGTLVLVRRISVNGGEYVQGCWLDWPAIRTWLAGEVHDLLPEARLEQVSRVRRGERTRMLAALPVCLVPGEVPVQARGALTPIRVSLLIAWVCLSVAAVTVAVLLRGAMSLSERRGAFVSAVTHEMRTPLTTFRMYTEMLAEGMVRDPEKQRDYLGTLRTEADRLGHLVENVLAYARLERGGPGGRIETVTVRRLLDGAERRLADRAEQAGMELRVDAGDDERDLAMRADPSAVEQILFNLVDNACKYAVSADDRTIHLAVGRTDGSVALSVCDHGPGVSPEDGRRLFRPFCKSARDAANSAPGVGLGLALSRRLARDMGGELALDPDVNDGAAFRLTLPRADSPAGGAD